MTARSHTRNHKKSKRRLRELYLRKKARTDDE